MTKKYSFAELFAEAQKSLTYHVEGAVLEFTDDMLAQMEAEGISRSELARRMGTSPAYITKILRGSTNFTLESMVKVAMALNCKFHCGLEREQEAVKWFDVFDEMPRQVERRAANQELAAYSIPVSSEERVLAA